MSEAKLDPNTGTHTPSFSRSPLSITPHLVPLSSPNTKMRDVRTCTQAVVANVLIEVVIAPPTLYLLLAREHLRPGLEVAAQNVFDKPNGAFTGEISVDQLKESGITWAILGHSERRVILQETDDFVANKTKAAIDGGLGVILCCGESLEQRESEKTVGVVTSQLKAVADKVKDWSKIVVAYEPIWYIYLSPSPSFPSPMSTV